METMLTIIVSNGPLERAAIWKSVQQIKCSHIKIKNFIILQDYVTVRNNYPAEHFGKVGWIECKSGIIEREVICKQKLLELPTCIRHII